MNERIEALRAKFDELKIDGMIVSANADQNYLAGFNGHADYDSVMVIAKNDMCVITDFRYWQVAEQEAPQMRLVKWERGKLDQSQALADFAKQNNLREIGFEAQHVNVYRF